MLIMLVLHYADLLGKTGITQLESQQETIQLGFRQWEGAFIFDGILSSKHHERAWKLVGDAIDRYLALFHRFQESRLCLGRSPVDLVSQNDLPDHRTRSK